MPTSVKGDSEKRREKSQRPESLLMRVKYTNTLPDIPFGPKLLIYPFDSNRFIQYQPTSLERNFQHEVLADSHVGVLVDLIDPDAYRINPESKLHPTDEKLLEDEAPAVLDAKRSRHHNRQVSWLRRTEYISNENTNRVGKRTEKSESKIGIHHKLANEDLYRDRKSQIDAIEETFRASTEPIQAHYSKPGVTAKEIFPILPDFNMWMHPCAQVIFDDNPNYKGSTAEDVNQALIRGMVDENGQHFVAYFTASEDTRKKRKRDEEDGILYRDDESYEYSLTREYNWNVKNKSMTNYDQNYFLVFRQNGVFYNELETRVRLSKRRRLEPSANVNQQSLLNKTKLIVRHRDFTDDELRAQAIRLSMLEEEEEEEEEGEEEKGVEGEPKDSRSETDEFKNLNGEAVQETLSEDDDEEEVSDDVERIMPSSEEGSASEDS